jgi:hypothetical protein
MIQLQPLWGLQSSCEEPSSSLRSRNRTGKCLGCSVHYISALWSLAPKSLWRVYKSSNFLAFSRVVEGRNELATLSWHGGIWL